jgi:hypothetical protein
MIVTSCYKYTNLFLTTKPMVIYSILEHVMVKLLYVIACDGVCDTTPHPQPELVVPPVQITEIKSF